MEIKQVEITKLQLSKNDILVVQIPKSYSNPTHEELLTIEEAFVEAGVKQKLVIMAGGIKLTKMQMGVDPAKEGRDFSVCRVKEGDTEYELTVGRVYRVRDCNAVFSHVSGFGWPIFHPEGEPDMQSCFTASLKDILLPTEVRSPRYKTYQQLRDEIEKGQLTVNEFRAMRGRKPMTKEEFVEAARECKTVMKPPVTEPTMGECWVSQESAQSAINAGLMEDFSKVQKCVNEEIAKARVLSKQEVTSVVLADYKGFVIPDKYMEVMLEQTKKESETSISEDGCNPTYVEGK